MLSLEFLLESFMNLRFRKKGGKKRKIVFFKAVRSTREIHSKLPEDYLNGMASILNNSFLRQCFHKNLGVSFKGSFWR